MLEYLRYKYSLGYSLTTSQVLALIFYQDTLKNFVYDTDASGNAILTNKGSGDDGLLNTGRGVELGATNDLPIDTTGCASLVYHDGINYVVVQSPSNPYTFNNQTILEVMPTTAPFTTADLALIQADTTLLARLALGEDNAGGLSLTTTDVYEYYALTEPSGATVYGAKNSTTAVITNYGVDETIRENVDQNDKSVQTTCLILDVNGVPTAVDFTKLNWYGDGYGDTQYVLPSDEPFVIEFAVSVEANGVQEIFGSEATGLRYRKFTDNNAYIYIGGTTFIVSETIGQYNFFACRFDGIDEGKVYVNNLEAATETIAGISSVLTFQLGGENDGAQSTITPINHFKIITGTEAENYDATKALEAYNDWAGI